MRDDGRIILRSYRLAFELERRIHRIDRFRIPLPYGLPLAALGYGVVGVLCVLVLSTAPLVGPLLSGLPLPVRFVFIPGLATHLLCRVGSDGRPSHEAIGARVAFLVRARRCAGGEPLPAPPDTSARVAFVHDERAPDYVAGRIDGPVTVTLQRTGRVRVSRRRAEVLPTDGGLVRGGQQLKLEAGRRLVIR